MSTDNRTTRVQEISSASDDGRNDVEEIIGNCTKAYEILVYHNRIIPKIVLALRGSNGVGF